jgi:hypothetical protein
MLLKHLFENELMPPKVLGHATGMFYAELVQLFARRFAGPEIDTKALEVNLDSNYTSANIMLTFKKTPNKLPALRGKITNLAAKYGLDEDYSLDIDISREDVYSHTIDVRFPGMHAFGLAGVDAMQDAFKKHLGEPPSFMEVNY